MTLEVLVHCEMDGDATSSSSSTYAVESEEDTGERTVFEEEEDASASDRI